MAQEHVPLLRHLYGPPTSLSAAAIPSAASSSDDSALSGFAAPGGSIDDVDALLQDAVDMSDANAHPIADILQVIDAEYDRKGELGSGHFGVVYLAVPKGDPRNPNVRPPVVIKVLNERAQGEVATLRTEANVLCKLHHPRIVRFRRIIGGFAALEMEFAAGGSLQDSATLNPQALFECQGNSSYYVWYSAGAKLHSREKCSSPRYQVSADSLVFRQGWLRLVTSRNNMLLFLL